MIEDLIYILIIHLIIGLVFAWLMWGTGPHPYDDRYADIKQALKVMFGWPLVIAYGVFFKK